MLFKFIIIREKILIVFFLKVARKFAIFILHSENRTILSYISVFTIRQGVNDYIQLIKIKRLKEIVNFIWIKI